MSDFFALVCESEKNSKISSGSLFMTEAVIKEFSRNFHLDFMTAFTEKHVCKTH